MSTQPSIPLTAKAAVLAAHKQPYEIKDHPVTQPKDLKPGECLIRLEYSGVCHSDWSIKENDWGRPSVLPLIGGHEGVGRIVAMGENPGNVPVKIGDRVGVKVLGDICSHCEACRVNADACCPLSPTVAHGVRIPGTFAQYIVSYAGYVTPIPESIDGAAAAPLLCAGLTIYKALKTSNARVGQWVAIGGAGGGLGHLGIQYAVAMGLRVIAIDTGEDKKRLCMNLGAEKWVDFKESQDIIKDVQAATDDGKGPHAAVIAVDNARPFNQALMYIRPRGTLVCVGMPGGTETSVNAPIHLLVGKSLTIVGSAVGNRQDAIEAVQLAASGKVKCQYQLRELNEINEVFDEMAAGKVAGRVVLKL